MHSRYLAALHDRSLHGGSLNPTPADWPEHMTKPEWPAPLSLTWLKLATLHTPGAEAFIAGLASCAVLARLVGQL